MGRFHALAEKKEHKSGLLKNDSSILCSMQQKDLKSESGSCKCGYVDDDELMVS